VRVPAERPRRTNTSFPRTREPMRR
jgi:hypothetical protein